MDIEIKDIKLENLNLSEIDSEVINEIKESLAAIGLLHHIAVIQDNEGRYDLITGKKRLRAFIEMGCETIPAKVLGIDRARSSEISLHENLKRENLPWWEIVELEAEFHNLRISQHGQRPTGRPRKGSDGAWSINDTAEELGRAIGAVSQDLHLATVLKLNPHLKNVQDKGTALKLARQIAKREQAELQALDPISSSEVLDQILHGNSLDILKMIPDQTYNVCITDPPWTQYKDPELTADASTLPVFKEVYRVLEYNSMLYMVVSTPDFFMYSQELQKFGFQVQQWPLIWAKEGTITHGRRGWEYARDFEPILVAAKGNALLTQATEMSSIITTKAIRSVDLKHPHEKPVGLITKLLKDSTYEGARALDPFGGSGVLASACIQMRRRYTVIERNHKFYENICKRISAESTREAKGATAGTGSDSVPVGD